jgi:ribose-phosphate pyrophosphokinase
MRYLNPANLAVVACPGGEVFANQVIGHLKSQYRHNFDSAVEKMEERYKLSRDLVIKQISFVSELTSSALNLNRKDFCMHTPQFKVQTRFTMFPNGELKAEIFDSVRGKDIFIVQDVENHYPVKFNDGTTLKSLSINDHLQMIYVTVDAVKQAEAGRITLVIPVYPYSRQHKKKGREGLTAGRIGKILEGLGVNRIITLDIHSREIDNSFGRLRLENLHASHQITRKLVELVSLEEEDLVVVAPDTGAVDRNKFYATALRKPLALLYKERDYSRVTKDAMDNNISEVKLLGNVKDKTVFMADDMLGTGGTMLKAMEFLKMQGAGKVICAISLPIFSGDSIKYFDEAYKNGLFYRIIGTNAVYHEELLKREWYVSVNVTKLFAYIISRLHHGLSVSSILDNRDLIIKSLGKGSG